MIHLGDKFIRCIAIRISGTDGTHYEIFKNNSVKTKNEKKKKTGICAKKNEDLFRNNIIFLKNASNYHGQSNTSWNCMHEIIQPDKFTPILDAFMGLCLL